MRFTLKKLGRLEEATIDLGKDLIVLTGPNNTSKTYVAHAIYGFCRYIAFELRNGMLVPLSTAMKRAGNRVEVDLLELIERDLGNLIRFMTAKAQEDLPSVLGAPESFTSSAQIQIELSEAEIAAGKAKIRDQEDHREVAGVEMSIDKSPGTGMWRFIRIGEAATADGEQEREAIMSQVLIGFLRDAVALAFFGDLISPHIMTAERSAVEIFSRELAAGRFEPLRGGDRPPSYTLALNESIKSVHQMASAQRAMSPLSSYADRLEGDVLQGSVSVGAHGQMLFNPAGTEEQLDMLLASSSVKSLAGLSFYLRHLAQRGHFLIIDEPELNLHPENQRRVARLLARLARSGIKVMISTHSDHIIRELNNLIMLSADKDGKLRAKYGYDEAETLPPERVGAYAFDGAHGHPLAIGPGGMAIDAINEVIRAQDRVAQDIYFSLVDRDEA